MSAVRKNMHDEWEVIDEIELPNNRVLRINTSRRSSGLLNTTATVGRHEGGFFSFMMFQDYSKTIKSAKVRCTQKAVEQQHAAAMLDIEAVKADVEAFYTKKETV